MPESNPIRIFVAHAFTESDDYLRVFEYLEGRPNFFYQNSANPDGMPDTGGVDAIHEELRRQISLAEVVLMPVALFNENNTLAAFELDAANGLGIPVVGINAFGATMVVSKDVQLRCAEIVDWNARSICDAARRQGRGEQTGEWEVVEFTLD